METDEIVAKHAEMASVRLAETIDTYFLLHVKKCPKWLPERLYRFILKKFLVLNMFKKL